MSNKVYEIVTNKIMDKLEQGVIPWRRPWNGSYKPVNWVNQRPYRGINLMLLEPGEYATYKQICEHGGKVKKGENYHIVVFWKFIEVEDEETNERKKVPLLRFYKVFEINTQCEGLESKQKIVTYDNDPIEEAEKVITGYKDRPEIRFNPGRAFYRPSDDIISVPPLKDYEKREEYYSTLFHEMTHSTGHPKRLKRAGVKGVAAFGSETYSKEELIAEMGASMLCGITSIEQATLDNSAAYIRGWLERLEDDKRLVVIAAAQAQKACDYILGKKHESIEN